MSPPAPVFRTRPIAVLVALALAASLAAVLLLAFVGPWTDRTTYGPSTYSVSAIGHRAVFEFFGDGGVPTARNHDVSLPALSGEAALVVAEPDWDPDHPSDHGLLPRLISAAARRGRPAIVVLPKWIGSEYPTDPRYVGGVSLAGAEPAAEVAAVATGLDRSALSVRLDANRATYKAETAWGVSYGVVLERAQTLVPNAAFESLVTNADGVLVAKVVRGNMPPIVLVTDPDLLNNQGLGRGEHAALLSDLIAHVDGVHALLFDETVHGDLRRGQLLATLLRFPALPITLQLLAVAAIAVWAFSGRFGTPRADVDSRRGGREVFIDTTARLLEGSVAEGISLARYWRHAVDSVSHAHRLPLDDEAARWTRLVALSSARGASDDPRTLAADATAASEGKGRPHEWIAVAVRIDRWRREMSHGPRPTP